MDTTDKIVEIEWEDSYHNSGWTHKKRAMEEDNISTCKTVGYLLKRNSREVTVYQSSDCFPDGNVDATMSIPKKCIKKIRELK